MFSLLFLKLWFKKKKKFRLKVYLVLKGTFLSEEPEVWMTLARDARERNHIAGLYSCKALNDDENASRLNACEL